MEKYINSNIFREYDIRGVVEKDFDDSLVFDIGRAYGTYLVNNNFDNISVSGDKLTIEGKAHSGDTDGFNYSFTINDNLDPDGIGATVIDGILTISIPYAEEVKPRKIKVKVK